MDTGATAHLHADSCTLTSVKNKCTNSNIYVLAGNGSRIPATKIAQSTLGLNPFCTFILKNVLIIPQIIKNLVSVQQFTRDNKCSIEFDEFGFSAKDFLTKHTLLRCDSTGDLYPVTQPSPQFFLTASSSWWHQRLDHPGQPVLKHLISRNSFIFGLMLKISFTLTFKHSNVTTEKNMTTHSSTNVVTPMAYIFVSDVHTLLNKMGNSNVCFEL